MAESPNSPVARLEDELLERLRFLELTPEARGLFELIGPVVNREAPRALERFYQRGKANAQTARFFSDDAVTARAKTAQLAHWERIAQGRFDASFLETARRIGKTHARIGLTPQWYIAGYGLVFDHLISAIVKEFFPRSLMGGGSKAEKLGASMGALARAVLLDLELAVSVYMQALHEQHEAAQSARLVIDEQSKTAVATIAAALKSLAAKQLDQRVTADLGEAFRPLVVDYNGSIEQLQTALRTVGAVTKGIGSASAEISAAAEDLSHRTEQQAASLEQTSAALEQVTVAVKKTAESSNVARTIVEEAGEEANKSNSIVRDAIAAMSRIEKSSSEISKIIGVIDEIAFQTNLLALNAGVEAARAGDAGRGFAVVASEVRGLAQRSAEAAKEIKGLITASNTEVEEGVKLVAATGDSLNRIVAKVDKIKSAVVDISASASEQSTALSEVNTAINQMDQATQQNAAMAEQATAASKSLNGETNRLDQLIGEFSIGPGEAPASRAPALPAPRTPSRAAPKAPPRPAPRKVANGGVVDSSNDWAEF